MRKIACSIVVIIIPILFAACSTAPPPRPDGCEHSLIYKVADEMHTTPQAVGTVFQLADLELIKNNLVAKDDVSRFLDDVESLLAKDQTTYLDVMTLIVRRVRAIQEHFGPEVMLLFTAFANELSKPIPLDPCDRAMLLQHVADQWKVLEMV